MAWRPLCPSCYFASDDSLHTETQPGSVLTDFSKEAGNPSIQVRQPGLCSGYSRHGRYSSEQTDKDVSGETPNKINECNVQASGKC